MKKLIQIVLGIGIVVLSYVLWVQIRTPMLFEKDFNLRKDAVVERLIDIRTAERAYKQKYQQYTGDFDSLIHFVLNDSLTFDKLIGSYDDSMAVAKGLVKSEKFKVAVIDTIFVKRRKPMTVEMVKDMPNIPFSETYSEGRQKFTLGAGRFWTDAGVLVPVFEAKAPYKTFLADLDHQELVNMVDKIEGWNDQPGVTKKQYAGLKVGALDQATNDAGNWE